MEHSAVQPDAWLVQTKLHPPKLRPDILARPRLEAALRSAVTRHPLTIISAPAGSGKTTLLASLRVVAPEYPQAWLSLDEEENDPTRFLATLTTALQRLHPEVGKSVWPLLQGGASSGIADRVRRVMAALINHVLELLPDPFLLVLDDLHVLSEPAIYLALEFLISHLPPQMRLIVGTRHDPPLPLARLAARRQLVELRRADLAFTPAEARQLLNEILALDLPGEDLNALLAYTEGWAVGLCLLAASLDGKTAPDRWREFLAGISQPERYVFDFLAEEVLRAQTPDVRQFLLQTSILSDLTPTACNAVTERVDSLELLEDLYRRNLFLVANDPIPGEPVSYRYHALFARFLERQLSRESPALLADLHRRAAEVQANPGRAVTHFISAGLWERAAQVMEQVGRDLLSRGMFDTLCSWYGALPEEVRAAHPRLTLLRGQGEIHRGDYASAEGFLSRAQQVFAAAGEGAGEGAAVCSLMTVAIERGDFARVRTLSERAERLPLLPQGRAIAEMNRTWLSLLDGHWGQAATHLRAALAVTLESKDRLAGVSVVAYMSALIAATPGCMSFLEQFCQECAEVAPEESPLRLGLDEIRTYLLLWRGHLDEAYRVGEAANAFKERLGGYPIFGPDLAATLAAICIARREPDAAVQYAKILIERTETAPQFQLSFCLHAAGRILCQAGRLPEAYRVYDRLKAIAPDFPFTPFLQAHRGGLLALAERKVSDAVEMLQAAAKLESDVPVAAAAGSARLLLARIFFDQGRTGEALNLLDAVLESLGEEWSPGRLLLEGQMPVPLLQAAAIRGDRRAADLLPLFGAAPGPLPAPVPAIDHRGLPEPLTPREIDVLRQLVSGASNRQIAERLYVSEQTVKTHVVHILRKLDVSSRTQAAIRGRELGL